MAAEEGALTFGLLLRRHRLAAGLTQEQLAERADVSRRAIDDLERGVRRMPYRDTVRRLATGLGLSAADAAGLETAVMRAHGHLVVLDSPIPGAADGGATLPPRLPAPLTSLVGREREVAALTALLRRDGVRLVTITGPGGIGKTRLSLQVAADVQDAFADGAWLIRLARLSDSALVIPTIVRAFDLKGRPGTPLDVVLHEHLRERRLLLVLDNFEHVIAAVESVATLLESCAGVKALVTSRIALHLRGEHHYALQPLALPDPDHLPPPEELSRYAAVALFIERAQQTRAESVVASAAIPAVAEICARLDGLPLAIELAAARIRLLPPSALLKRMELALPLLRGGARDLDARQQTMRRALAWSYDLLTPAEQRLFRRLAVFAGGWTLEAAEAVCAAPEGAEPLGADVLSGLGSLLDQSLLQHREENSEARFGMLHVIREFAIEQLEAVGASGGRPPEAESLRRAHAVFYERQAADWRARIARQVGAAIEPANQTKHAWIESERENLRAVLSWALQHGEPALGLSVARTHMTFWMRRGLFAEGRQWFDGLLALASPAETEDDPATTEHLTHLREHQAYGYYFAGTLVGEQGGADNLARSAALLQEAAQRFRDLGDLSTMAAALLNLAAVLADLGAIDRADAMAEESLRVAQQLGQSGAMELAALGQFALQRDDLDRAWSFALEALRVSEHAARPWERPVYAYWTLAQVALRRGDITQAQARVRDALRWTAQRDRHIGRTVPTLELFCLVDAAVGRHTHVAYVQGALETPTRQTGAGRGAAWRRELDDALARSRAAIGAEAWQIAYATGRACSLDEVVADLLKTNE